jgi:hypothetical protein
MRGAWIGAREEAGVEGGGGRKLGSPAAMAPVPIVWGGADLFAFVGLLLTGAYGSPSEKGWKPRPCDRGAKLRSLLFLERGPSVGEAGRRCGSEGNAIRMKFD